MAMKKVMAAFAAAALGSVLMAGTGLAYEAGTYQATVPGRNGDLTVEVTFTDDAIESVEVTDHLETDGIGTNAWLSVRRLEVNESAKAGVKSVVWTGPAPSSGRS